MSSGGLIAANFGDEFNLVEDIAFGRSAFVLTKLAPPSEGSIRATLLKSIEPCDAAVG
jgi:hypothetical protein